MSDLGRVHVLTDAELAALLRGATLPIVAEQQAKITRLRCALSKQRARADLWRHRALRKASAK